MVSLVFRKQCCRAYRSCVARFDSKQSRWTKLIYLNKYNVVGPNILTLTPLILSTVATPCLPSTPSPIDREIWRSDTHVAESDISRRRASKGNTRYGNSELISFP